MRTRNGLFLLFLFFNLISLTSIAAVPAPPDLLILTEDYAPYNYVEDNQLKGISVEILESAFHHMDMDISRDSFHLGPWAEGYETALIRNNTLLFTTARIPEREHLFTWAGPLFTDKKVLFGIAGHETHLTSSDITSYRIVAIRNDSGLQLAIDAGISPDQVIVAETPGQAIAMVENGTADVWSYGEMAGRRMISIYAQNPGLFAPFMEIATVDEYLAFHPDTDPAFVATVNETIREMRQNRAIEGVSEYAQILYRYLPVECHEADITPQMVTDLVNLTCDAIIINTSDSITRINSGEGPFKDPVNPGLYVFVYNSKGTVVAHADDPLLVGKNFSKKADITGKLYHDEIFEGAGTYGTGWVHYVYTHPARSGIYPKKAYYRLVTGSDGDDYIVVSGRYMSCAYLWQSPGGEQDRSIEIEVMPDGKMVLCGTTNTTMQKDILLLRYLPDGKNDPAFGKNGVVRWAGGAGKDDYAFGVVYDNEGRILVAGREHNGHDADVLVLRYTYDGELDTTFGENGVFRYAGPGNGTDSARGIVVRLDGKILITGEMNSSVHKEMIAIQLLPDGKPDTTFGDDGLFVLNITGEGDRYGFGIVLDAEDNTVITGGAVRPGDGNSSIVTTRLRNDGSVDESFGLNGTVFYLGEAGGPDYGNWVSVTQDGEILVTGAVADANGSYDIILLKYTNQGVPDPAFGDEGIVLYHGLGYDYAWGQDIQKDGKIIIAGTTEVHGERYPVLLRYGPDGRPDPSFGEHGVMTFEAFGTGLLYGVHLDNEGNIYANGYITKDGKETSLFVKIHGDDT